MTDYSQATDEQLAVALRMAIYDVQRYKNTSPIAAEAAERVRRAVLAERNRRPRCSTR